MACDERNAPDTATRSRRAAKKAVSSGLLVYPSGQDFWPRPDGHVGVSRAPRTLRFPSRFTLIAASNRCLCGYAGCDDKPCSCSVADLERHLARLCGPLADHIDLHVHVQRVAPPNWPSTRAPNGRLPCATASSAARGRQRARYAHTGASLAPGPVGADCHQCGCLHLPRGAGRLTRARRPPPAVPGATSTLRQRTRMVTTSAVIVARGPVFRMAAWLLV